MRSSAGRAGGALAATSEDPAKIDAFQALWRLAFGGAFPGAIWTDGVSSEKDSGDPVSALEAAFNDLRAEYQRKELLLPAAPPYARRAPRTGEPAVASRHHADISESSLAKQRAAKRFRLSLDERLLGDAKAKFPVDMERPEHLAEDEEAILFPFKDDKRDVAWLHLDGNGVGAALARLRASIKAGCAGMDAYAELSRALAETTEEAARHAVAETLLKNASESGILPARPVLLGGDDLTIVLRADVALPFARAFIAAFAAGGKKRTDSLRERHLKADLPDGLYCGGGLAYAKAGSPFDSALRLCTSVADYAKNRGKEAGTGVSALSWYRETASASRLDYGCILDREYGVSHGGETYRLSYGAYEAGKCDAEGLPNLDVLYETAALLRPYAGALRRIVGLYLSAFDEGGKAWKRLTARLEAEGKSGDLQCKAARLGIADIKSSPFAADKASPLADISALLSYADDGEAQ